MSNLLHALLRFLFQIGYFGPFVMGVMDSSFLFLPFGNDLLVVALVARHHPGYLLYVLSAATGSTVGVVLLDLVARKAGETGIQKITGERRFNYLKRKIGQKGVLALVIGCLAPPPFPFTMAVATLSALGFPRTRMLITVWLARAARFLLLGFLALRFGRRILAITHAPAFTWTMVALIALCLVGSGFSVAKWLRRPKAQGQTASAAAA